MIHPIADSSPTPAAFDDFIGVYVSLVSNIWGFGITPEEARINAALRYGLESLRYQPKRTSHGYE